MPNHVLNILSFEGEPEDIERLKEFVKVDDGNVFHFNNILPMPESLDIVDGTETRTGMDMYEEFLDYYLEKQNLKEIYIEDVDKKIEDEYIKAKGEDFAIDTFKLGKQAMLNIENYEAPTWYLWRIKTWGTKWEAMNSEYMEYKGADCISFETAWSPPDGILQELSNKFPEISIRDRFADENFEFVGDVTLKDGIREDNSPSALEDEINMYCDIWNLDDDDRKSMRENFGLDDSNEELEIQIQKDLSTFEDSDDLFGQELTEKVEKLIKKYPISTRIELLESTDENIGIPNNSRGTVIAIDDLQGIHVSFDNGRIIRLEEETDKIHILDDKELKEENKNKTPKYDDIFIDSPSTREITWITKFGVDDSFSRKVVPYKVVKEVGALRLGSIEFFSDLFNKAKEEIVELNNDNYEKVKKEFFTSEGVIGKNFKTRTQLIDIASKDQNLGPPTKEDKEIADEIKEFLNRHHDLFSLVSSDEDLILSNVHSATYLYNLEKEIKSVVKNNVYANDRKKELNAFSKKIRSLANKEYKKEMDIEKENLKNEIVEMAATFQRDPEIIKDYLEFGDSFHNYSARNRMLIFKQNKNAFFVGSADYYRKEGYKIKKGEEPIKVLVPMKKTLIELEDGKTIGYREAPLEIKQKSDRGELKSRSTTFFNIGNVYDISQTNWPLDKYPEFFDIGYSSIEHKRLFNILKDYAQNELGVKVNEDAFSSVLTRGEYDAQNKEINISKTFDDTTKLSIISHELGHALLHSDLDKVKEMSQSQIEFEADAFSIMLSKKLNVEIPESRKDHLANVYRNLTYDSNYSVDFLTSSLDKVNSKFKLVMTKIRENTEQDIRQVVENKVIEKNKGINEMRPKSLDLYQDDTLSM